MIDNDIADLVCLPYIPWRESRRTLIYCRYEGSDGRNMDA